MTPALTVRLAAGCTAHLSWPTFERVVIEIHGPDGTVTRRVHGPWTQRAIRAADAEIRHVATCALQLGAPAPARAA